MNNCSKAMLTMYSYTYSLETLRTDFHTILDLKSHFYCVKNLKSYIMFYYRADEKNMAQGVMIIE